jgi:lipopolysaccharide transport system permease protein
MDELTPAPTAAAATAVGPSGKRWVENAPSRGWFPSVDVGELWASRELVYILAMRNVKIRYKQTALGAAWAVVQPLTGVAIFTIVMRRLAHVPSEGIPYPAFAFAGLILWTYFTNGANQAADSLAAYRDLVTKVYFPRMLAPIAAVLPGMIDFAISFAALVVLMIILGVAPGAAIVFLPLWVLALAVITCGVGIGLSAVNARYRDVRNALGFLLQIGLFATPVVYPSTLIHGSLRAVLYLNPMAGVVDGFRWSLLDAPRPAASAIVSLCSGMLMLTAGLVYFARVERRLADVI